MKLFRIKPEFVDEIPPQLDPGKLYVCCRYRAVKHLCACGCGVAVNTPLHPTGWTLVCDGVSVSLFPSIGNWNEMCRSHYSIRNNKILWASKRSGSRKRKAGKARSSLHSPGGSGSPRMPDIVHGTRAARRGIKIKSARNRKSFIEKEQSEI